MEESRQVDLEILRVGVLRGGMVCYSGGIDIGERDYRHLVRGGEGVRHLMREMSND